MNVEDATGPGLTPWIKEQLKSWHISTLTDIQIKAIEAGADDFISKPFERLELVARVKSLVKVKAFHNQTRDYQKKLEDKIKERTEELKKAYMLIKNMNLETIIYLSRAAEYKDQGTGAHIIRMASYSSIISKQLNLDQTFLELFHIDPTRLAVL